MDLICNYFHLYQLKHPKDYDFGLNIVGISWERYHFGRSFIENSKSLTRKMFANALGAPKDSAMESEAVESEVRLSRKNTDITWCFTKSSKLETSVYEEDRGGFQAWQIQGASGENSNSSSNSSTNIFWDGESNTIECSNFVIYRKTTTFWHQHRWLRETPWRRNTTPCNVIRSLLN